MCLQPYTEQLFCGASFMQSNQKYVQEFDVLQGNAQH